MSVIKETHLAININKIPDRIALYERMIDAAEPLFEITGTKLEDACKNHAKNLLYYDLILQECKTIEDVIKGKLDSLESDLFRHYNENYQRSLGTRDIQQYIKGDPKHVAVTEILHEVMIVKRKLEAIVEALKSMGWSLNNIVKLRISQLENAVL